MAIQSVTLNISVAMAPGSSPASFPNGNIIVTKPTLAQAHAEAVAVAQARVNTNTAANEALNEFITGG